VLRNLILGLAAICFAIGLILLLTGSPAGLGPACFGALLLLGTLWERVRYKPLENARPGAGWIATDERFVDDETGKPVRVWLEPGTGERRYVAE
jgi:hypothetical protein